MAQSNDELILHLELINVEDGSQLWGAQFRRLYSDVLTCPEKLGDGIWSGMQKILAPDPRMSESASPQVA